jgi:uncharacterized protein (DUF2236 family)
MRHRARPADVIVLPGVREAIETTKSLVARSVRSLSPEDAGHFGPGSVSWRIFSHASYGVSGIAAVLMQALHPIAMAAVDRHSNFSTDAWRRAHLTADYVFTITFSSRPVADAAAERVRDIHRQIGGVDPATGRAHRADEPELLLWVHAVHTEYALRGYERFVKRLAPADQDRFVREQVAAAGLVGLDRAIVPATRAALGAYIDSVRGLAMTDPARRFARMLIEARMPPTMRPFWALHVAGAASLLPQRVRDDYELPRWLFRGRPGRAAIATALWAINYGYLLFRPVREARARLRQAERAARERTGAG